MHKTVLLKEAIDGLNIHKGDIFLDCTLGNGGHSLEVCKRFGKEVKILGLDLDKDAISKTLKNFEEKKCHIEIGNFNFRDLDKFLQEKKISKLNKVLFDLGVRSEQIDESGRGFTFQKNEPLLMTMKKSATENDLTAFEIVNTWQEESIKDILQGYGEEKFAWRIAKKIVEARENKKIENTFDLVEIIKQAVPVFYQKGRIYFATKTFQALRIAVNDELGSLREGLEKSFLNLDAGGRIAVISFHSLEDRIVKNFFRDKNKEGVAILINKKPILPSDEEVLENRRSRSAKLRVLQKK